MEAGRVTMPWWAWALVGVALIGICVLAASGVITRLFDREPG